MTSVTLITHTEYPAGTLRYIWDESRGGAVKCAADYDSEIETESLVVKLVRSAVPVIENVSFTFLLSDMPVALREQIVRHRIGVKCGDQIGMDSFPDLADSTWWAQSMRVLDMGEFPYHMPDSVVECGQQQLFELTMNHIRSTYQRLVGAGVPAEDARMVVPLGATHAMTWTLNLAAIKHILSKRSCWILQLGLWGDVIAGITEQLRGVFSDRVVDTLVEPPCLKDKEFKSCVVELDNEKRVAGEDPLPPCALWAMYNPSKVDGDWQRLPSGSMRYIGTVEGSVTKYHHMKEDYARLWGVPLT